MLKYKNNPTLSQGGLDIGLKVGILAEIGYMLQECAVFLGNILVQKGKIPLANSTFLKSF